LGEANRGEQQKNGGGQDARATWPGHPARSLLARTIFAKISAGEIRPRIEPSNFTGAVPEFPQLDAFRLLCARRSLPIVDVWHKPCSFPQRHFDVLAKMDGGMSRDALAAFAAEKCPELAFEPWIAHLAWRGFFVQRVPAVSAGSGGPG